jgi:6-phospho-beta-glucosidase
VSVEREQRVVVLGGSSVATPGLALALRGLAAERRLTLVLHGRSPEKLGAAARAARIALRGEAPVEHETELARALEGADVVLNQVRVGGLEGRRDDESFPRELGLVGEETLGAGGFANALRTLPVVLELAEAIARHAPGAVVVNLTNPASLVQQALALHSPLRALSVCDVPVTLAGWVHELVGEPPGSLRLEYFGTNHLGWATAARDASGADRLPEALERLETLEAYPVDAALAHALGVLPGPYLRYVYEPDRYAGGNGLPRAARLLEVEQTMLAEYAALHEDATPEDVARIVAHREPHWYEEIVVPVIAACLGQATRLVVQVTNEDNDPRLPAQQAIEVAARVEGAELEVEAPPELPPDCRAVLEENAAYEQLAVEAIVERDRGKALRALVLNPLVGSVTKAAGVLEQVWPRT